jgi:hypothetical protein
MYLFKSNIYNQRYLNPSFDFTEGPALHEPTSMIFDAGTQTLIAVDAGVRGI